MKIFLIIILFPFHLVAQNEKVLFEEDKYLLERKGSIRELHYFAYRIVMVNGEIQRPVPETIENDLVYKFSAEGLLTERRMSPSPGGPLITIETYTYDSAMRLTAIVKKINNRITEHYSLSYNDKGQVISKTKDNPTPADRDAIERYSYDEKGRLVKREIGKDALPVHTTIKYAYDKHGELAVWKYITDHTKDIKKTKYKYNALGQKVQEFDSFYNGKWQPGEATTYDNAGNVATRIEGTHESRYTYDKNGNWIKRVGSWRGVPEFIAEVEIEYYE